MHSRTLWLAVGVVAGLSVALVQGCSTPSACDSTSCPNGCCDSAGACQPGNQPSACGSGGLCHACGAGQTCLTGFCTSPNTGGGSAGGGTGGGGGGSTGGGGGGSTGGGGGGSTGGGGGGSAACDPSTPVIAHVDGSGGCTLRMVSPAPCSTVNFNTLGYVEFAWTTNTTFCEGPHHFLIGGNPPSSWNPPTNNGISWSLTSTDGTVAAMGTNGSTYAMTRNLGGLVHLVRADLAGVTSDNGQFHVIVRDFYDVTNGGSLSDSVTFTIAP